MNKGDTTGGKSLTFFQAVVRQVRYEMPSQVLWFLASSLVPGIVIYVLIHYKTGVSPDSGLLVSIVGGALIGLSILVGKSALKISQNNLLRLVGDSIIRDAYDSATTNISTSSLPRWSDWFLPAFQEHLSLQVGSMVGRSALPSYVRVFVMSDRKDKCEKWLNHHPNDRRRAEALVKIHSNYKISVGLLAYEDLHNILESLDDADLAALKISGSDFASPKRLKNILGKLDFSSIVNGGVERIFKAERKDKGDPRWEFHEVSKDKKPTLFSAYQQLSENLRKTILDTTGKLRREFSLKDFLDRLWTAE